MADSNVVALQNAINRFAGPGGFSKISADGGVGNETAQGFNSALAWITSNQPGDHADTASSLQAQFFSGAVDLTASASGLATFLNLVADDAGLAKVNSPVKIGPITFNPTTAAGGAATSLVASFQALPVWQKVAGGILLGLAGLYTYKHYVSKKHGGLKGVFGLNGIDYENVIDV